ncbi:MAG: CPXCG motif-containing cysteine-rich protein [Gammaproteobacteria bacterium]|nr:CPXCG motif-containing cysteine-rich protein [Gammaproteobacteria bacterium]
MVEEAEVTCPWCWESVSLTVDLSEDSQSYIEDCPVCCHPMQISVQAADGELISCEAERTDA